MPFNTLLLTSLTSKTGFSEHGGEVSVKPESHEIVLFFNIDSGNCAPGSEVTGWNLL